MKTLHVVSHTHWDREWYHTFQDFRFRLVRLVDRLLDLLESEPEYRHFTLDGQTVVLDDYLTIRPEQEPRLRRLIEAGRVHIGPWYVLPDEFLEGPEPMIRNLLMGQQGCRRFTAERQPMETIAYIPDSFGHVSQIPQIAAGFGMAAACVWRGIGPAPTEFRWASPDGTECLMLHLRESYSNGAWLASDVDGFVRDLGHARDALSPHAPTGHLLIMNGTDHMEPRSDLPALLREAQVGLGDEVLHSTLPDYLANVEQSLGPDGLAALPLIAGEMRSPERAHLLPAVLSARMWIKQSNSRCESLLARCAEPFSALAEQVCGTTPHRGFLRQAWLHLLQNHPHDSICGCSIDQVHDEMRTRFSWSEQIAEEVTNASLVAIAKHVESCVSDSGRDLSARVVVFNPTAHLRTDRVRAHLPMTPNGDWHVTDDAGRPVPHREVGHSSREFYNERMTREQFLAFLAQMADIQGSQLGRLVFSRAATRAEDGVGFVDIAVLLGEAAGGPSVDWNELVLGIQNLLADESLATFHLHVIEETGVDVEFLARDTPSIGYRQFCVSSRADARAPAPVQLVESVALAGLSIENEFYSVEANPATGTLTITDKSTGRVFAGMNQFVDGGDRGDEYTFCAPEHDSILNAPTTAPAIRRVDDGVGQAIEIELSYWIPASLADGDRSSRGLQLVEMPITSRVALTPGVRRIEIESTVANQAGDHRLRVHFPVPFHCDRSWAEGHFDVLEREAALPANTEAWAEQPVGTQPQLTFVDLTDGQEGLLLANQGLPEYELLPADGEAARPTLALTLLRCVGWLSRGDLSSRAGPAGPALPTPGAQCQGWHTFRYALVPHAGNYLTSQREAHSFIAPLRAACLVQSPQAGPASDAEADLSPAGSFVQVSPAAVVLTALKPPQQGEGMILRVYNSAQAPVLARVRLWRSFREISRVQMDESGTLTSLAQDSGEVAFPLRIKEIVTLLVEP